MRISKQRARADASWANSMLATATLSVLAKRHCVSSRQRMVRRDSCPSFLDRQTSLGLYSPRDGLQARPVGRKDTESKEPFSRQLERCPGNLLAESPAECVAACHGWSKTEEDKQPRDCSFKNYAANKSKRNAE
jgi:hypothetical protein